MSELDLGPALASRPSDSNISTQGSTQMELDEEEFVDVDDDVGDQGGDSEDEVESVRQSSLLAPTSSGRIFMVERVQKATGGHRPNMLFDGRLVDVIPQGAGHHLQHVASSKELQLSLRYEPPSPKFARSCPDMTSYRLKLLQGTQFIYLLRGLPRVLVLDQPARAVGWGALQLVFATTQQLECFLAVLRHVSVVPDQLWPRHIACLWRPNISEQGAQQPGSTSPPQLTRTSEGLQGPGPLDGINTNTLDYEPTTQPTTQPTMLHDRSPLQQEDPMEQLRLGQLAPAGVQGGEEEVEVTVGAGGCLQGAWGAWVGWAQEHPLVVSGAVAAVAAASVMVVIKVYRSRA